MIKKYSLIAFLFFCFQCVFGQIKYGIKPFKLPLEYEEPTGQILKSSQINVGKFTDWIVYSDRANNQTYIRSNGKTAFKIADFMEPFWVIDENSEYVRIVKFDRDKIDPLKRKIDASAIDYGWINKKNLLLWNSSLVDSKSKFNLKNYAKVNKLSGKIWDNPNLNDESKRQINPTEIFFIFKTEGNANLIAGTDHFEAPASAKYHILGWVNKNDFIEWSGRLCIEVNNDFNAINERKKQQLEATIFSSSAEAIKLNKNLNSKSFLWQNNVIDTIPFLQNKKYHVVEVSDNIAKVIFNEKSDKEVIQNTEFGFAALNNHNLIYPLFKYSIFLTDDEFTKVIEELKQFELKTSTGSEGREQLQKVFKQILQTYLGASEAKKRFKNIGLGEVLGLVTGLSSTSTLLSKWKIDDLTNEKVLNNSDFNKMVDYITSQSEKLQKIKGIERNKYKYQEDDKDYFWVPAEFMP